jgi:hypothetical protein
MHLNPAWAVFGHAVARLPGTRVLGFVNNLRLRLDDGNERKLTEPERQALVDLCSKAPKLTFAKVRTELKLGKLKFSIEDGGEKNAPCDLTVSRLRMLLDLPGMG